MSTPLFNQDPKLGAAIVLGASLATYSSGTTMAELVGHDDEPVLIDEVRWCTEKFATLDGMLVLAVEDAYGTKTLIGAYDIAAGTSALFSSGIIALNLLLEEGFRLVAAHNVTIAGPTFVNLDLTAIGGVVR